MLTYLFFLLLVILISRYTDDSLFLYVSMCPCVHVYTDVTNFPLGLTRMRQGMEAFFTAMSVDAQIRHWRQLTLSSSTLLIIMHNNLLFLEKSFKLDSFVYHSSQLKSPALHETWQWHVTAQQPGSQELIRCRTSQRRRINLNVWQGEWTDVQRGDFSS